MQNRRAFTLIELLVVVAIIVALIAILLPSLNKAIAIAEEAVCRTQQRQIGQAFLTLVSDTHGTLPGIWTEGPEPLQKAWAAGEVGAAVQGGGTHDGSLVRYVGGADSARALYRCPSLPAGTIGSGIGSNGRFDYAAFHEFSGAKIVNLPTTAIWIDAGSGETNSARVPLIIEEDPAHHINTCCIDAGHGNTDQIGAWHRTGANVGFIDGSVVHMQFTTRGPTPWEWTVITPSGVSRSPGGTVGFGGWNSL